MSLMQWLGLYAITFAVFFLIDLFWLGVVGKGFYRKHLGALLSPRPRWGAAIAFYLLYVAGLLLFVILPARRQGGPSDALLMGALFSLIAYATYDLTNLATIKDWPVVVTVVDLVWGTVLGGSVSLVSSLLARAWLKP